MSLFDVAPSAYDGFMGRYAGPLAPLFTDWSGVAPGSRVLDVGCGPATLTSVLADRLGPGRVAGLDPSAPFVAAARERLPGVQVEQGVAEDLPWGDDEFDLTLAQLVVHFMADPVQGLREMARVTRPGGVVAACVWDHAGGRGPLSPFWQAVVDVLPESAPSAPGAGSRRGHLGELFTEAGLDHVVEGELTVRSTYADLEEWWEPYLDGVGPAGGLVAGLDEAARSAVRDRAGEILGPAPFTVPATAWTARATAT